MPEAGRGLAAYRAALYIRLSKEDEGEGPSESVQNQEALLRTYAAQHGLTVCGAYVDDGWSGTNFDRPGFQRLLRDIEAGAVDLVLTKDLSRLGRDYILTGHYLERYFPEHGVRYISLLDGIDTGADVAANEITPFRAILNDLYAKDISKKIKSVKREKQRRGLFIGGKPVYGYQMHPTEKNKIVVDEEAAVTVRSVFAWASGGMSCRQIAARLNRAGVPTPAVYAHLPVARPGPYTGQWSSERISEMLRNETYLGHMVQGRSVKVSYKSKKCRRQAPSDWVVVEGTHTPLVDEETFARVQRLLAGRRRTRSRTYEFLLKGLIFCRECGSPLGVLNRKNAKGEDVLYFVCRTYQRFTKAGVCTSHTVKVETVTKAVLAQVERLCRPWLTPETLLPAAGAAWAEACREGDRGKTLQSKIDLLTARLDRLYEDRLSGLLPEADFQRLFTRAQEARAQLQAQLEDRASKGAVSPETRAEELVRGFLQSASRDLVWTLLDRVELTADKEIRLTFRCRPPADSTARPAPAP